MSGVIRHRHLQMSAPTGAVHDGLFAGHVEADDIYVGGRAKNKHARKRSGVRGRPPGRRRWSQE